MPSPSHPSAPATITTPQPAAREAVRAAIRQVIAEPGREVAILDALTPHGDGDPVADGTAQILQRLAHPDATFDGCAHTDIAWIRQTVREDPLSAVALFGATLHARGNPRSHDHFCYAEQAGFWIMCAFCGGDPRDHDGSGRDRPSLPPDIAPLIAQEQAQSPWKGLWGY
jgi:hypothetical protein